MTHKSSSGKDQKGGEGGERLKGNEETKGKRKREKD